MFYLPNHILNTKRTCSRKRYIHVHNYRFNIDNFIMQIHNFIVNNIIYSLYRSLAKIKDGDCNDNILIIKEGIRMRRLKSNFNWFWKHTVDFKWKQCKCIFNNVEYDFFGGTSFFIYKIHIPQKNIQMYIYTYIHTYIHTYIYIYIYTHIYIIEENYEKI